MVQNKRFLFCVCSLGFGHAARTLRVIQHFLPNNKIYIMSHSKALAFLKLELKDANVEFIDFPDYPEILRGTGLKFHLYLALDYIKSFVHSKFEHIYVNKLVNKYKIDFIFADQGYGCWSKKIPCFLMTHYIQLKMPQGYKFFQSVNDHLIFNDYKHYSRVFINDYADPQNNLTGELSHNWMTEKLNSQYIGIISSVSKVNIVEDIDYLFIFSKSGYLTSLQDMFFKRLFEQAKKLNGKKVFVLGDIENGYHEFDKDGNEIYSNVTGKFRDELYSRAKVIVTRSGFATIMDIVELEKKGVLIPAPNQDEQAYLAKYLGEKGYFVTYGFYKSFDFSDLPKRLAKTKLFNGTKTNEAIRQIDETISMFVE